MPSLKNPQLQIPGGFTYYVPETRWQAAPFSSLDSIVAQLIAHRKGRPDLVAAHGWSLDPTEVYQEVLNYQVAVCVRHGWTDYLLGGVEANPPFPEPIPRPSLRRRARNLAAGIEHSVQWKSDGYPTVPQELAEKRAHTCCSIGPDGTKCPMNGDGGLEAYFTIPAQNAIKKEIENKKDLKLATSLDDKLGVCEACTCPLPLKMFSPIALILKKIQPEAKAALHPACWILSEEKALQPGI